MQKRFDVRTVQIRPPHFINFKRCLQQLVKLKFKSLSGSPQHYLVEDCEFTTGSYKLICAVFLTTVSLT